MKRSLAALSVLILASAPGAAQTARISEAAWLSPEADLVEFLTTAPAECLAVPGNSEERYRVDIGRVAFRSPFLLGGQAARGRLSCSACHVNGRTNADFYIDGISSEPGTADVTSSIFSAVREDRVLNARPIPDLVDRAARAEASHGIEQFIESAVVDEFQGAAPPRAVIDGLVAYVSALQSAACKDDSVRQTPRRDMRHVARALAVADAALARGDGPVADFALISAQGEVGRIAERFPNSADAQAALSALARRIGSARAIAADAPKGARFRIAEAAHERLKLSFALKRRSDDSLYDRTAAAAYLSGHPRSDE